MTADLDAEWLQMQLSADAARFSTLLLQEGPEAADAFRASVDFDARVQAWKAIR